MPNARVSVPDILDAIREKLVLDGAVKDRSQVKVCVRREEVPHVAARNDVVLKPGRFLSIQPNTDGGMRRDTRVVRTIAVQIRTTFLAGGGGDDKEWAANHYPFEDAVLDSLHGFHPVDDNEDALLLCPMRLTNGEGAERESPNYAWGDSVFSLEVEYYPKIRETDEA